MTCTEHTPDKLPQLVLRTLRSVSSLHGDWFTAAMSVLSSYVCIPRRIAQCRICVDLDRPATEERLERGDGIKPTITSISQHSPCVTDTGPQDDHIDDDQQSSSESELV
jgi:hypothetical protein